MVSLKRKGRKIVMLTAYDYPTALLADQAGVDVILVGDSLAMVVLGYETTLPVTMEEMLVHVRAVGRARPRALVVADMPFMSFQASPEDAVRNAGRMIKEGGADAVKLEGGKCVVPAVAALGCAKIPVMGHIGLTPQAIRRFGGYKVQGKTGRGKAALMEDAVALEEAGCFALVIEGVPWKAARDISQSLKIPTVGIGAGPHCDGQVLVCHDLLGLYEGPQPRFVRRYADLRTHILKSFESYAADVRSGDYPTLEESYHDAQDSKNSQGST
jgi:3-methyl-2-oxobutanoate hydroxymethyltransferase